LQAPKEYPIPGKTCLARQIKNEPKQYLSLFIYLIPATSPGTLPVLYIEQ